MVRISDARMSGTAYGTVILHVAPEAAVGGPPAFVHTGDIVCLDLKGRSLSLDVPDEELNRRQATMRGQRPMRRQLVAGRSSTSTTSCRRTLGRISISLWEEVGTRSCVNLIKAARG